MQPREQTSLTDMLNSAKLAQEFVSGITWEEFERNLMCQSAVSRQIEIIGEAARRISVETHTTIPEIPWHQIIEMKNRITHEYDDLDLKMLWDTVQIALPKLVVILEKTIKRLES
jgi:uncharacterized protein with HEPN domain